MSHRVEKNKHPYEILVRPVLTEKATNLQSKAEPQYTFQVSVDSTKIDIRKAVELAFKVKVTAVNTVVTKGKRKRQRTAKFGRRPTVKKAIITLAKGQSINLV